MNAWDNEIYVDPMKFWKQILERALEWTGEIPEIPDTYNDSFTLFERRGLVPFYMPKLSANQLVELFPRRLSDSYNDSGSEHIPLVGRWLMVETVMKPNKEDPRGYGKGVDPLCEVVEIGDRRRVSPNLLHDLYISQIAGHFGVDRATVQLPSVEEWRVIAYLFQWIEYYLNMTTIQDITDTNLEEWCRNESIYTMGGVTPTRLLLTATVGAGKVFCVCRNKPSYTGPQHGGFSDVGFRLIVVL